MITIKKLLGIGVLCLGMLLFLMLVLNLWFFYAMMGDWLYDVRSEPVGAVVLVVVISTLFCIGISLMVERKSATIMWVAIPIGVFLVYYFIRILLID